MAPEQKDNGGQGLEFNVDTRVHKAGTWPTHGGHRGLKAETGRTQRGQHKAEDLDQVKNKRKN